jgi:prepilin-type N-terminal cleavage/methylation domain-containing protein
MKKLNDNYGFTIVELLIATVVFSVVLIGLVGAVTFISSSFTKGSLESKTQSTARIDIQKIGQQIQLEGGQVSPPNTLSGSEQYICVGDTRFTFELNTNNFTEQAFPNCTSSTSTSSSELTSLLSTNMVLGQFSVVGNNGLYTIHLLIGYGTESNGELIASDTSGNYTYSCQNSFLGAGAYCAVSDLTTVVDQRQN